MFESLTLTTEVLVCLKILLAAFLGFLMGAERFAEGKYVGPRTFALIGIGACVFTSISLILEMGSSSLRIASMVISGVGFLGAGAIWKMEDHVHGITTAATIWVTAAVGMLVGFGYYAVSLFTTLLVIFLLTIKEDKIIRVKQNCK